MLVLCAVISNGRPGVGGEAEIFKDIDQCLSLMHYIILYPTYDVDYSTAYVLSMIRLNVLVS